MGGSYRLAVLADIHGNGPAFLRVLADIDRKAPVDAILVAGDMIGGPDQEEILSRLLDRNAVLILGNWERTVLDLMDGRLPDFYSTAHQFSLYRWSRDHLSLKMLSYLRTMPEQVIFSLPGADPIRMVHGTPDDIQEKLRPERNSKRLEDYLASLSERVMIFGHTHCPWSRILNAKLAFNPGAVRFAQNRMNDAQYAILEWQGQEWDVNHFSVFYD